jgi:hypothetical protein
MKIIFNLLLTLVLLVSNLNCKRIKYATTACNKKHRVEIPQRVKDYFYFKDGTYWVYQNQKTLATDSHWVCDSYLGTKEIKGNSNQKCHCFNGTCYENMKIKILDASSTTCTNNGSEYLQLFITLDYNEAEKYNKNYYRFLLETGRATSINAFWHNGSWFMDQDGFKGNELKDTSNCNIKGANYKECIIERKRQGIIFDHYKEVLIARNIGIVSYINYYDSTRTRWSLIRSSIIK